MNPMLTALPTIVVTSIYYFYHVCRREQLRRARVLRERVAYMLWVIAQDPEDRAA
jgi:hypothetical protein